MLFAIVFNGSRRVPICSKDYQRARQKQLRNFGWPIISVRCAPRSALAQTGSHQCKHASESTLPGWGKGAIPGEELPYISSFWSLNLRRRYSRRNFVDSGKSVPSRCARIASFRPGNRLTTCPGLRLREQCQGRIKGRESAHYLANLLATPRLTPRCISDDGCLTWRDQRRFHSHRRLFGRRVVGGFYAAASPTANCCASRVSFSTSGKPFLARISVLRFRLLQICLPSAF